MTNSKHRPGRRLILYLILCFLCLTAAAQAWELDARQIHGPDFRLQVRERYLPGSEIEFQLEGQPLSDFKVRIYSLQLTQILQHPRLHFKPELRWQHLSQHLGTSLAAWQEHYQKPQWEFSSQALLAPALAPGAYVLEVEDTAAPKTTENSAAAVFLVSDLELAFRQEPDQIRYTVYHRGQPVENAELRIKVIYRCGEEARVRSYATRSNAQGEAVFYSQSLAFEQRAVEAFAFYQDHYALTQRYPWKNTQASCPEAENHPETEPEAPQGKKESDS